MNEQHTTTRDTNIQLTAILLTPQNFDSIRETIGYLASQTVCEQMELLVLVPQKSGLDAAQLISSTRCATFGAVRVVDLPETWTVGAANALAVRETRAPLVVFCEDHSFPEPEWAHFLVEAHRADEKRAVVGPCVLNANRQSAMSWANFLTEYGAWTSHASSYVASHLPGHNSCYKRAVLLAYGDKLEAMLEAESVLHWDLQRDYVLYLEARARTHHLNFSVWKDSIPLRFYGGQSFAAARSQHWPKPRRLLFALAAPLIPFVRWNRILPIWKRCLAWRDESKQRKGAAKKPRGVLPLLATALVIDALGELCGYAFGAGKSREYLWSIEFDRRRFMRD